MDDIERRLKAVRGELVIAKTIRKVYAMTLHCKPCMCFTSNTDDKGKRYHCSFHNFSTNILVRLSNNQCPDYEKDYA